MMKKIICFSFTALSFISLAAQMNRVVIDAVIRDLPDDSVVYWTSINNLHDDSVKTFKGGFHIEIPIQPGEGNMYIIQIGEKYSSIARQVLYLEPGMVLISGEGPMFRKVKLSGSQFMLDYNDYLELVARDPVMEKESEMYAEYEELERKNDTIALAALEPKLRGIDSVRRLISRNWIQSHPASPISAYILYSNLKSRMNMSQLDSMLKLLSQEAKNNLIAKGMANSITIAQETGIGKPAKDFTQNDTANKAVSLKDFRGKYVLLDFWASWCGPCRLENPNVVAAYQKYRTKNFTVISVSLDQGEKNHWMKAIHQDGLIWTNLSDLKGWNNAVAKLYDIQSVPSNFLIDPNGIIIAKNLRGEELNKKLSEIFGD